jgi:two-component system, NtrC family, response regulator AtoC
MAAKPAPSLLFQGLKIFLVDDEDNLAWGMETQLRSLGADVKRAASVQQANQLFPYFQPDLVVTDLNLPDGNGLELLRRWKKEDPTVPVILITAHPAVDSAVTALRLGAYDYLQKPFDMQALVAAISRAAEVGNLRKQVSALEGKEKPTDPTNIIGESATMQHLEKIIQRVAKSKTDTVLIYGESGTGKELVARALHDWSDRADEPFVEINCASIPETLLESELFGYEKGAFTDARDRKLGLFEIAGGGTVFLDEIGEMPLTIQAKLLRVIEYRRFKRLGGTKDIAFTGRIVAATNRRLEEEILEGRFRNDLFYRMEVVPIRVPPLRDRPGDVPLLAEFLVRKICNDLNISKPKIAKEALRELEKHRWPGNVRELKNVLHRTIIFHQPSTIEADMLEFRPQESTINQDPPQPNSLPEHGSRSTTLGRSTDMTDEKAGIFHLPPTGISLEELEKSLLIQALEQSRFNQTKAAQLLRITRHTLRYRLEKFGLLETVS